MKARPSVADALLSFGIGTRDVTAAPSRSQASQPQSSGLQDPPTLLLVNFITAALATTEENILRKVTQQQNRLNDLSRQARLLKVQYENSGSSTARKKDLEIKFPTQMKRRNTFSMPQGGEGSSVRYFITQILEYSVVDS
jgi:hypothetical protein